MNIDLLNRGSGATDKFVPRSLLEQAETPAPSRPHLQSGNPTSTTISISILAPGVSKEQEPVEANDAEIIALFLEIEPEYSRTNRLLADL
jgi:hypothetical protein